MNIPSYGWPEQRHHGDAHNHQHCNQCGGRLIHQERGAHESSSTLGQVIHDWLPETGFGITDIDAVSYRNFHGKTTLRLFEMKSRNGGMGTGQSAAMRAIGQLIELGQKNGVLTQHSGAWLLRGDAPFTEVQAKSLTPSRHDPVAPLTPEQLARLLMCETNWLPAVQGSMW